MSPAPPLDFNTKITILRSPAPLVAMPSVSSMLVIDKKENKSQAVFKITREEVKEGKLSKRRAPRKTKEEVGEYPPP